MQTLFAFGLIPVILCAIKDHISIRTPYPLPDSTYEGTPPPPGCVPVHVNLIARHGIHYPSKSFKDVEQLLRSLNPSKPAYQWVRSWNTPYNSTNIGLLAPEGEKQMFELGDRISKAFPELFGQTYSPLSFPIRTTQLPRSAMSGQAFAQGAFDKYYLLSLQEALETASPSKPEDTSKEDSQPLESSPDWDGDDQTPKIQRQDQDDSESELQERTPSANATNKEPVDSWSGVEDTWGQHHRVHYSFSDSLLTDRILYFHTTCQQVVKHLRKHLNLRKEADSYQDLHFNSTREKLASRLATQANADEVEQLLTNDIIVGLWELCGYEYTLLNIDDRFCALFDEADLSKIDTVADLEFYYELGYGNDYMWRAATALMADWLDPTDAILRSYGLLDTHSPTTPTTTTIPTPLTGAPSRSNGGESVSPRGEQSAPVTPNGGVVNEDDNGGLLTAEEVATLPTGVVGTVKNDQQLPHNNDNSNSHHQKTNRKFKKLSEENSTTTDTGRSAVLGTLRFGHARTLAPFFTMLGLFNDSSLEVMVAENTAALRERKWRASKMLTFGANLISVLYKCPSGVSTTVSTTNHTSDVRAPSSPVANNSPARMNSKTELQQDNQNSPPEFLIKFMFNEKEIIVPSCESVYCHYLQFRGAMQERAKYDFDDVCKIGTSFWKVTYPLPLPVITCFAVLLAIALILLIVKQLHAKRKKLKKEKEEKRRREKRRRKRRGSIGSHNSGSMRSEQRAADGRSDGGSSSVGNLDALDIEMALDSSGGPQSTQAEGTQQGVTLFDLNNPVTDCSGINDNNAYTNNTSNNSNVTTTDVPNNNNGQRSGLSLDEVIGVAASTTPSDAGTTSPTVRPPSNIPKPPPSPPHPHNTKPQHVRTTSSTNQLAPPQL